MLMPDCRGRGTDMHPQFLNKYHRTASPNVMRWHTVFPADRQERPRDFKSRARIMENRRERPEKSTGKVVELLRRKSQTF